MTVDKNYIYKEDCQSMGPATRHYKGEDISTGKGLDGVWLAVDYAGQQRLYRQVSSVVDGTLKCHLSGDPDATWCNMKVVNGTFQAPVFFDKVDVDNSTAGLFTAGNMIAIC